MNKKLVRYSRKTHIIFILPAFLLYSYFFFFSLIKGAYYSLTNWNGISSKLNFIGFQNFARMFGNQRFIHSLGFTFYYTFILLVVSTILGLILALMLNEKFRGQIILRAIYFFPAVLSLITVGLIWNEIFYRVFPAIGEFLGIELLSRSLLSSSKMAVYAVVMVNIWQFTGMAMILFLAGLQSIPEELYEAAVMDGANYFKKFLAITLPYLMPIMQIVIVLGLKTGITVFDYIIALTGGGPAGATESIGILIYNIGFDENKFGYASAQAMVLFIIIVVISFIQIKVLSRLEVE